MATTGTDGMFSFPWIQYGTTVEANRELLHFQTVSHNGTANRQDPPWHPEQSGGASSRENHHDPEWILFLVVMAVFLFVWCLCLFSGIRQGPDGSSGNDSSYARTRAELQRILETSAFPRQIHVLQVQEMFTNRRREFLEKFLLTKIYASNSHDAEEAIEKDGSAMTAETTITFNAGAGAETDEDRCAICLAKYFSGDEVSFSHQCCHMFHKKCITEWLLRKDCCPCCRIQFLIPTTTCSNLPREEQSRDEEDVEVPTNDGSARNTADFEDLEV